MRYAAPPTGELRWQAPRSLQDTNLCWTSHNKIYKANNFQSSCYQYDPIAMRQGGSEDCLFVNVWTPQLEHDAMLDVMVYIHGGGLMVGSGNIEGELEKWSLTHCDLVTPYSSIDLGQHWLR